MTSLTDTGRAAATSGGGKYDWLKAHIGSLAIAFGMVFAASVWGYVNSTAFAVFFMGFVAFLIFFRHRRRFLCARRRSAQRPVRHRLCHLLVCIVVRWHQRSVGRDQQGPGHGRSYVVAIVVSIVGLALAFRLPLDGRPGAMRSVVGKLARITLAVPLIATPALALEPKQCLPMAQLNSALAADGQRTLVLGDRIAVVDDESRKAGARVDRYANAVTSNADGSLGYQLEGDMPRAQASTSMCVRAKLTNIHLLDARVPGVRMAGLLGAAFDDEMREKEKLGTRPMVMADTLHSGSDGKDRPGLPMVLFGNIKGGSASLYVVPSDRKPSALMLIGDVEYTPEALRRLDGARR